MQQNPIENFSKDALIAELKRRNSTNDAAALQQGKELAKEFNIKAYQGKGVVLPAQDVVYMVEALNGRLSDIQDAKTMDYLLFAEDSNPISVLESAQAEAIAVVQLLDKPIESFHNMMWSPEAVYNITLMDINDIGRELCNKYNNPDLFNQMSTHQFEELMKEVLGISLDELRRGKNPAAAPKIDTVVNDYIASALVKGLDKVGFSHTMN